MIHALAVRLVWWLIKALVSTYKVVHLNREEVAAAKALSPKDNFVFAIWHSTVLGSMVAQMNSERYIVLASRSKDGDFAAYVAEKMGFECVRGSSAKRGKDKGGKAAIAEYTKKMHEGRSSAMTVDGPKGPVHVCKPGVPIVARETGAPILPVANRAKSYWEFNSWDRMKIPKPFTTIYVKYGQPMPVAPTDDIEETCRKVEQALLKLEAELAL